jgi:hypothetical protein
VETSESASASAVSSVHSPGAKLEGATADDFNWRGERAGRKELHGSTEGIASGQIDEGTAVAVEDGGRGHHGLHRRYQV